MGSLGFRNHDHGACISEGVLAAQSYFERIGLKFSPVRQRVLEILLESHQAIGAYQILERLRRDGFKPQPPIAYRSLEFLARHGFVHKIEKLNAFIACTDSGKSHNPAFLICRLCKHVAETHSEASEKTLGQAAESAGFAIERTVLEAEGICPNCKEI